MIVYSSSKTSLKLSIGATTPSVPLSLTKEFETTTSSTASGLRRLRMETSSSSYPWCNTSASTSTMDTREQMFNSLEEQLKQAFLEKNYKDANTLLDHLERMLTPSLLNLSAESECVMSGIHGCISEMKACCMAMIDQPQDALKLHEEAMQQLKIFGTMIEMILGPVLHLQEGLYLLLNNDLENAIIHLRKAGTRKEINMLLLLAALERQLEVELMEPIAFSSLDTTDISRELFLQRRYEEALSLLANPKNAAEMNHRGHCHAMLGQIDEALAWYDAADQAIPMTTSSYEYEKFPEDRLKRRLAHLIVGNLEEAKHADEFTSEEQMLFYEILSIPLNLAIKWIEQRKNQ